MTDRPNVLILSDSRLLTLELLATAFRHECNTGTNIRNSSLRKAVLDKYPTATEQDLTCAVDVAREANWLSWYAITGETYWALTDAGHQKYLQLRDEAAQQACGAPTTEIEPVLAKRAAAVHVPSPQPTHSPTPTPTFAPAPAPVQVAHPVKVIECPILPIVPWPTGVDPIATMLQQDRLW